MQLRCFHAEKTIVLDPVLVASAIAIPASMAGGKALVYGLESIVPRWRRPAMWVGVTGAAAVALAADLWSEGPGADGAMVFLLAALPGAIAFLVWRTLLASALVSLLPFYYVISEFTEGRSLHAPITAVDQAVALQPAWMIVYASLYVFVMLPLFVVRQNELLRRSMRAYLAMLVVAFLGFLAYPTIAPRPADVAGEGFAVWALRLNYALDSEYNCLPSLHVANAFVAAFTVYRVHRGVGIAALAWAALIGVSTLFTKQHYFVDVIAGAAMASIGYVLFLRSWSRSSIGEVDRRLAPRRAAAAAAVFALMVGGMFAAYQFGPQ